jgi:trimethylamine-N-oxide reductase (cytochrome c)
MMVVLVTMQGLGKPGVCILGNGLSMCGPFDGRQAGLPGYADCGMNMEGVCKQHYNHPALSSTDKVLTDILFEEGLDNPPIKWRGGRMVNPSVEDFYKEWTYPLEGEPEIRMIWTRGSTLVNGNNNNRNIRGYQNPKIETVVSQAPWFDRDCRYADLVLPVTTNFEREDLTEMGVCGVYVPAATIMMRCQVYHQQAIAPVGESKTDLEICTEMAKRLGILEAFTEGNTEQDWLKKLYATTNIPMEYEDFKEKGYYVWPSLPDYKPNKQLKDFYEYPEDYPLETPSGKIEIFSQWIFEKDGVDNPECHPVPHYIPEKEGRYSEDITNKYPLQLLVHHPKWRFHGKFEGVTWTREFYKVKGPDGYEYEPMYMNPADAEIRGIQDGDIARAFNDRGQILCGIVLTDRLIRGVARCPYGAWPDPLHYTAENPNGAIDRGGNANRLTPSGSMSSHHQVAISSNSTLIEVEKADLEALAKKYPEGWAGKYSTWRNWRKEGAK